MSYGIEQHLPAWRRIDFASPTGLAMAAAGAAAIVVKVNALGWWGFATSWIDLSVLTVWLGLAAWLSIWAFENAEGWWHIPSFLGVVVSVIGLVFLLALAVMSLISEHPDILADDSKPKRKRNRNRRRQTTSSRRQPDVQGALTGVGLCVLLVTAAAVMLLSGGLNGFSVWAGEILGALGEGIMGWYEQQSQ